MRSPTTGSPDQTQKRAHCAKNHRPRRATAPDFPACAGVPKGPRNSKVSRARSTTASAAACSVDMFAPLSAHLIAVEPNKDLVDAWHDARRATGLPGEARVIGQIPICWDPDRDAAVQRAHDQFRWFGGGWAVNADLPTTAGFEGATQFVRPEDVADSIPCRPDFDAIVDAVRKYWEAGFTAIALVQIGDDGQELFLKEAAGSLLEKLRTESH